MSHPSADTYPGCAVPFPPAFLPIIVQFLTCEWLDKVCHFLKALLVAAPQQRGHVTQQNICPSDILTIRRDQSDFFGAPWAMLSAGSHRRRRATYVGEPLPEAFILVPRVYLPSLAGRTAALAAGSRSRDAWTMVVGPGAPRPQDVMGPILCL
jgi:hypothetical protein